MEPGAPHLPAPTSAPKEGPPTQTPRPSARRANICPQRPPPAHPRVLISCIACCLIPEAHPAPPPSPGASQRLWVPWAGEGVRSQSQAGGTGAAPQHPCLQPVAHGPALLTTGVSRAAGLGLPRGSLGVGRGWGGFWPWRDPPRPLGVLPGHGDAPREVLTEGPSHSAGPRRPPPPASSSSKADRGSPSEPRFPPAAWKGEQNRKRSPGN